MILDALLPAGLRALRERRQALRDLRNFQQLEHSVLALDESNLVNRAKAALETGDHRAARTFWQDALVRYPDFARGHRDALAILLGLQCFDEAEAVMLEGQKRWPRDLFYGEGYAQVADRRGATEAAIERWALVRKKHPSSWKAYVDGAVCLARAGRQAEAEALIDRARARFPDAAWAWIQWARFAEDRHDWPEALRRLRLARERSSDDVISLRLGGVLTELERFDEAEACLREAQLRSPLSTQIAVAQARLAERRGDDEEAARRWAAARRRFPTMPFGYQEGFRHLAGMGRDPDAEEVLLAAIERFPEAAWPAVEYAGLASKRQDWAAAETRWQVVRARWPDRDDGYVRGAEAMDALGHRQEAEQVRADHRQRRAS